MKNVNSGVMVVVLLILASSVRADEHKIPLSEVPKAAIDAVKLKFPRAELKEAVKSVEKNETTFEISLLNAGKHITVSLDGKGEIEEIETEIAVSALPRPVTDAIAGKYPKATVKKAEEVVEIEDGKEEKGYEVEVVTAAGKSIEVELDASGKIKESERDDK
jgi:hypothetical protein